MADFLKSLERRHHTYPACDMRGHARASRGIRKMASPIKHVLLFFQQMNVHQENDATMNPAT